VRSSRTSKISTYGGRAATSPIYFGKKQSESSLSTACINYTLVGYFVFPTPMCPTATMATWQVKAGLPGSRKMATEHTFTSPSCGYSPEDDGGDYRPRMVTRMGRRGLWEGIARDLSFKDLSMITQNKEGSDTREISIGHNTQEIEMPDFELEFEKTLLSFQWKEMLT
jgi:hypothetical protein